jgi:DNA-binding IclR family transcriptional regulator
VPAALRSVRRDEPGSIEGHEAPGRIRESTLFGILIRKVNLKSPATIPKKSRSQRKRALEDGNGADQYFSRAVGKALEILEFLQAQELPLGLNDITRQIGLTKASAFRLLRTLENSGYLATNADGTYEFVPEFGTIVPSQFPMRLVKVAAPHVKALSRELRETVSLAVLFENRSEVVAVAESPELIRMSNVVGHILPPNASSLGKVITAFQSSDRREKLLRSFGIYRFTECTITDTADLNREYELIKAQGFATDREETVPGGNCFGVPIFSPSGKVAAAVSMSIPKLRLGGKQYEDSIKGSLTTLAKKVSSALA